MGPAAPPLSSRFSQSLLSAAASPLLALSCLDPPAGTGPFVCCCCCFLLLCLAASSALAVSDRGKGELVLRMVEDGGGWKKVRKVKMGEKVTSNRNKSENKELMKKQSQLRNQTFCFCFCFCLVILLLASDTKGQNSFG